MLVIQRNTFDIERDVNNPVFRREMVNLTPDIVEAIEERVPEIAGDMELSDDDVTITALTNAMLWQFVAFVTQRPDMPHSEILDIRQVDHEAHATAFFQQAPPRGDSPVDESILSTENADFRRALTNMQMGVRQPAHEVSRGVMDYALQVKELESQLASLEAENARLKAQNEALEQRQVASLRYKQRKPNRGAFASLDSYIATAVAVAVQQALAERGL